VFPPSWYLGIGAFIASAFWLIVLFVVGAWAGWPRAREREAWEAAEWWEEQCETLSLDVERAVLRLNSEYAQESDTLPDSDYPD
jgi:hypothetical protein